ncbi:MAG: HDIG domain-containing protein [Treponema sp.]|nr:HDIG domain-containing protein [Treponema sp.]
MTNNPNGRGDARIKKLIPSGVRRGPALAWGFSFLLCLAALLANQSASNRLAGNLSEFQVGRVAERDVIAERTITYIDERATGLRIDAQERLVPAVFHYSHRVSEDVRSRWGDFSALIAGLSAEENGEQSRETFMLMIQSEFPGYFSDSALDFLYRSSQRHTVLASGAEVLNAVLEQGIFSLQMSALQRLNPDVLELIRHLPGRIEQERIPFRDTVTRGAASGAITALIIAGNYTPANQAAQFAQFAPGLLEPFLRENVFFSPEDTAVRVAQARAATEPVMRTIEQGQRVITRGFLITEDELAEFNALRMAMPGHAFSSMFAKTLFLLLLFTIVIYFCGTRIIGRSLRDSEVYLVSGLSVLYIAGAVLLQNVPIENFPVSVVAPTALVIMLPSILIHPRLALLLAMALPLGAFLTGSFDSSAYVFAVVSGVVAAYSLQRAEKRMELVKAGLVIAVANLLAMTAVLLWQNAQAAVYPQAFFWAAFNGLASGMLVLGALPPLENALNASTSFRLIELSDLNVPILRRLFTTAPGTYSHSIMVANLAEAACIDIGANSLLTRVGAYYHDLGKMENPEYFVENQTNHNRHDDIAPRLSATVIRSHVKLGIEKARQLNLPREVIEIIGEHHGNSVIKWFYTKALKQEGKDPKNAPVNAEDFSYPGTPPRSRESAVVMLADVTEAAVRTLDKPTAPKIEKYIQELFDDKIQHGQLTRCELTFLELEKIKNSFVRVLVAYYHSRIEYPKSEAAGEAAKQ